MTLIQVGLVDTTGRLDPAKVQAVAAALNVQVMRDLPQIWTVQATVRYLPNPKAIPSGVWPVLLVPSLPPGEGGFHLNKHKQPYAEVIATPSSADWSIDASHETIEMLVDPYGSRFQASRAIEILHGQVVDGVGEFQYLVEACDPCEANDYAYPIQGVAVSDFLTPHYYDPVVTAGTRYSFTGAIKAPRQLLPGGYISFVNMQLDRLQQILFVDPSRPPMLKDLGPAPAGLSVREWVENNTYELARKHHRTNHQLSLHCEQHSQELHEIALKRAALYPTHAHKGHAKAAAGATKARRKRK
jgi:hypothetical protein